MNNKTNHDGERLSFPRAHDPTPSELIEDFKRFILKKYKEYNQEVSDQTAKNIAVMIITDSECMMDSSSIMNLFVRILTKSESDLRYFLLRKLMIANQKVSELNE